MVPIERAATDLPFTILDVAALLRLNIRRSGAGQVYADCPLCGDRRGKLSLCPERNVWHCFYCGEGGGMLALYAKARGIGNGEAYREICEALHTGAGAPARLIALPPAAPRSKRAPDRTVHQTLAALLSLLTLTPAHRAHLRYTRGLTDEQIDRFGFRSAPRRRDCRALTRRLTEQGHTVEGVPGFYLADDGVWTVRFHDRTSGILIPIRGADGLLRATQTRLDRPLRGKDDPPEKVGAKYLTLSSAGKNLGTSPAGCVHFVGELGARAVYVTEGALKADICHALTGRTFLAVTGANNLSGLPPVLDFLRENGTEIIVEALDMDKYTNRAVRAGAEKICRMAAGAGLACRRLVWDPRYKGMDDWQLAVRKQKHAQEAL